jgi:hypothetical protein
MAPVRNLDIVYLCLTTYVLEALNILGQILQQGNCVRLLSCVIGSIPDSPSASTVGRSSLANNNAFIYSYLSVARENITRQINPLVLTLPA